MSIIPTSALAENADPTTDVRRTASVRPTPPPGAEPAGRRLRASGRGHVEARGDAALVDALRAFAERQALPLEALLEGAWALVTLRFSGEHDVVFATATGSGAWRVARVALEEGARVTDALAAVGAASDYRAPWPASVEVVTALRSVVDRASGTDASSSDASHDGSGLRVDVELGAELTVSLEFDRARFRPGMPERVARAFLHVLAEIAARGQALVVRELGAVPPDERERQLVTWNQTDRAFPSELLLHEPFEARVLLQPDAVALETSTEVLTYAELDARANRLAHALRARGAAPTVKVAVCLPRRASLVVALLAVVKAGAAYVPLDPSYPEERLARVVADAAPLLVVTEQSFAGRFGTHAVLLLDAVELEDLPATPVERAATPADVCYVIYTSGSTGTPKGAVLEHRAVINTCDWVNRTFAVGPGDRLLFVTSPSFDLSVYDTFGALGAGATVVLAEAQPGTAPEALAARLATGNVTIWDSAPAALEVLTPFFGDGAVSTTLRLVLLSGDFIPLRLLERLRTAFPNARLVSLGGATEAAIWSNYYAIGELEPDWVSVPYGKPIQNCRYYALDARLEPVPIGAVGELYIGGACLAAGYLNRPELTSEKFVPNPFAAGAESRLYRTGDLVRYFESGDLEILGRADRQTKIRGYRIELGEVEAALRGLPAVHDAVCAVREIAGDKDLVGYVVLRPGHTPTEADVKHAVGFLLPAFMVPGRIAFLPGLAISPNGKVDRNALPDLADAAFEARAWVAPRTETERRVAEIWQRLLAVPRVGACDNFFELGGHSLTAVRLVNELKRAFSTEVPLVKLLEHPTVEALAECLDRGAVDARAVTEAARARLSMAAPALSEARRTAARAPLHCIGGVGGNPFGIRRLAAELGPEQPVVELTHGGDPTGRSVASIARDVAEDVRRHQPEGPYYLAGFSAGGIIALEAAKLLREQGATVALVVLLDTFNPKLGKWSTAERVWLFAQMCRQLGLTYARGRLLARLRFKLELLRRRTGWLTGPVDPDDPVAVQAALALVLRDYAPGDYDGDVLLLRAEPGSSATVDYRTDEFNGWRHVAPKLEVATLPCRHEDILRDHASGTARALEQALARARDDRLSDQEMP